MREQFYFCKITAYKYRTQKYINQLYTKKIATQIKNIISDQFHNLEDSRHHSKDNSNLMIQQHNPIGLNQS